MKIDTKQKGEEVYDKWIQRLDGIKDKDDIFILHLNKFKVALNYTLKELEIVSNALKYINSKRK